MDISVIVPIYNEIKFIDNLMNDLLDNINVLNGKELDIEFLLIDGGSYDGTLEKINAYVEKDTRVKLFHNKMKFQVHAMNLGVKMAKADIIIRCDAHSSYPNNYFTLLYKFLKENSEVGNIGLKSVTKKIDDSLESQIVSDILSSKFGVGSGHRNINSLDPVIVDTLLFGAWHKKIFDEVGLFDESFIRGQDYEHNYRIRKSNKKVLIIPGGEFVYYTRNKLSKMFKMIFQYAHAKTHVMKKHKTLPTLKSMLPVCLWLITFLSIIDPIFLLPFVVYLAVALFYSFKLSKKMSYSTFLYFIGFIGVHFSYFLGFIKGLLDYFLRNKNEIKFNHTR
jgi:glycosyltransferase involved in cell wall biosynthesis